MSSIKLILKKDKIDKSGEAPLYLRLIKDRKTKFISLSLKLNPNEWDEDKQKVKKNHSNSGRLNAYISQKVADAKGDVADLERKNKSTSARKLKEAIKGTDIESINKCSEELNQTLSKLSEKVYQQTQENPPKDSPEAHNSNNPTDENIQDADFEVVENEAK